MEAAGLVKFDFLGLRTLTIIDWAMETINREPAKVRACRLDIAFIPLDDKPTFSMLQKAETTAVFQLESRGMKELIKKLKPDCLEDLIALVALFRPGPLQSGMVDDFINRKHGRAPNWPIRTQDYQYEGLKPVLAADLRHHPVSRTGDADRPGDGRLHPRRCGHAASRHG